MAEHALSVFVLKSSPCRRLPRSWPPTVTQAARPPCGSPADRAVGHPLHMRLPRRWRRRLCQRRRHSPGPSCGRSSRPVYPHRRPRPRPHCSLSSSPCHWATGCRRRLSASQTYQRLLAWRHLRRRALRHISNRTTNHKTRSGTRLMLSWPHARARPPHGTCSRMVLFGLKPVAATWIMAVNTGGPPFSRSQLFHSLSPTASHFEDYP